MNKELSANTTLSHYRIMSKIGAGGMGEVYLAQDTRLDRKVAIKVLPADFAADKDRLQRFEQEAKATSALNHPNILTVYDIGEYEGSPFIVAELLEGEELRQRLDDGPIPLRKVSEYAQQIVSGLSAAHAKGIVHRDLKPENLFVTKDDRVKILDFGLAKLSEPGAVATGSEDATRKALTNPGVVMGTVGYMSPEQVRGHATDYRSDIFSFGAILHEMITGRRSFRRETMAETMSAILKEEPDELTESVPNISPSLERIVRRCLEKKPERRFQSTSDLGFALESLSAPTSSSGHIMTTTVSGMVEVVSDSTSARKSRLLIGALAILAVGFAAFAGWMLLRRGEAPVPTTHLSIALPEGHSIISGPAISRDGRRVTFVSSDGVGRPQLYVRALDEGDSRLLPGTEEANNPFFSPDGQWIAFYARNQLFKVKVDGGAPVPLAASSSNEGGTWTDSGSIIYKRTWSGGFEVVSENGGESKPFLAVDSSDDFAYAWPYAVPGGRDVLFASWGKTPNLFLLDTKTMSKRMVVPQWWRRVAYMPPGYVVGGDDGGELRAAKLAAAGEGPGKVVTVVKGTDTDRSNNGNAFFDVSQNGTLVYVRKERGRQSVVIVDRQGQAKPVSMPESQVQEAHVSPDGHRAATVTEGVVHIVDLERGTTTPLVPEIRTGSQQNPVWSPDGRSVTFCSNFEGNWDIYSKPASGAGSMVPVLKLPLDQFPQSYASDGTLLLTNVDLKNGEELWMLPPGGDARVWLSNGSQNQEARFSPDGSVAAYSSNTSGRSEVYVQSRDNPADRVQVSAAGGKMPVWSPNGKQLFFRQGNVIMETTISGTGGLSATVPVRLFDGGWTLPEWFQFDVMPDGQHFVMVQQPRDVVQTRIEVVLNWFPVLKESVGDSR
jgi:serine/threonine protein kinase